MTDEEKQADCLVRYAGQPLTTGKQAECYANEFIGLHVRTSTGGRTYAELGTPQSELRKQIEEAKAANDPAVADLEKQLGEITATRETAFKGETLRPLLLTSYGFSEFGAKGGQAATVAYIGAALMALLSAAGFVHAFTTPKTECQDEHSDRTSANLLGAPGRATSGPQAVAHCGRQRSPTARPGADRLILDQGMDLRL